MNQQESIRKGRDSRCTTLLADTREAERFLTSLSVCDTIYQTFCDKKETKSLARIHYDDSKLLEYNTKGAGIFFTVNHIPEGLSRAGANVDRIRYLFVDLDDNGLEKFENVLLRPPLPDHVVMSSPNKFHCYWRAVDVPVSEFRQLQHAFSRDLGGDPAVKDPARVMRVPGYIHWKNEPFRVRYLGSGAWCKKHKGEWNQCS